MVYIGLLKVTFRLNIRHLIACKIPLVNNNNNHDKNTSNISYKMINFNSITFILVTEIFNLKTFYVVHNIPA